MTKAVLHLGSNLGDKKKNLKSALIGLQKKLTILKKSAIYVTEAWGDREQPSFYNQGILIDTIMSPWQLLDICRQVTIEFPEKDDRVWGPRYIDIDIIFYGDEVINSDVLKIPHPRMHLRNFVLIPLLEIAPEFVHPILKKNIVELKRTSSDPLMVNRLNE